MSEKNLNHYTIHMHDVGDLEFLTDFMSVPLDTEFPLAIIGARSTSLHFHAEFRGFVCHSESKISCLVTDGVSLSITLHLQHWCRVNLLLEFLVAPPWHWLQPLLLE